MPQAGPVDVKVYDVRGALVRELVVSKVMPAGRHAIEWDNRNRSGDPVRSGIYFIRAEAGGKTFTTRLSLLR
jgi:flagellar hook assembly protein FlgD